MEIYRNYFNLGVVARKLGLLDDSIESLKIAANALNPSKAIAWNSLGLSYFEKGNIEAALSSYNSAI